MTYFRKRIINNIIIAAVIILFVIIITNLTSISEKLFLLSCSDILKRPVYSPEISDDKNHFMNIYLKKSFRLRSYSQLTNLRTLTSYFRIGDFEQQKLTSISSKDMEKFESIINSCPDFSEPNIRLIEKKGKTSKLTPIDWINLQDLITVIEYRLIKYLYSGSYSEFFKDYERYAFLAVFSINGQGWLNRADILFLSFTNALSENKKFGILKKHPAFISIIEKYRKYHSDVETMIREEKDIALTYSILSPEEMLEKIKKISFYKKYRKSSRYRKYYFYSKLGYLYKLNKLTLSRAISRITGKNDYIENIDSIFHKITENVENTKILNPYFTPFYIDEYKIDYLQKLYKENLKFRNINLN